jgi:hypothetical protein
MIFKKIVSWLLQLPVLLISYCVAFQPPTLQAVIGHAEPLMFMVSISVLSGVKCVCQKSIESAS